MLEAARTGPLVLAAGEGLSVECFGTRYVVKASAAETGGALGLFEGHVPPGDGPPMHLHGGSVRSRANQPIYCKILACTGVTSARLKHQMAAERPRNCAAGTGWRET